MSVPINPTTSPLMQPPYGYGTADYAYGQDEQARMRREMDERERLAQEAYNRWLVQQNLGLQQASMQGQMAGQEYQNRAAAVYNANQAAQARQGYAATQFGLGNDVMQTGMQVARMQGDLRQNEMMNRRYLDNLNLDLARAQNAVEQRDLAQGLDYAQVGYQRGRTEVPSSTDRFTRLYGYGR